MRPTAAPVLHALAAAFTLAACQAPTPAPLDEADFDPVAPGTSSEALSLSCAGAPICSGDGAIYAATYRVGEYDTSRMDLLQVFEATADGVPDRLRLFVRSLRAFSGPVAPQLRVDIYDPPNPAQPDVSLLTPLASGSAPIASLSRTTANELTFTTATGSLVTGHRYVLRVWSDGVGAGGTGGVLLGIGAFITSAPAWDATGIAAFVRPQRRATPTSPWGESRPRPAGPWDLAIGLTVTGVNECAQGLDDCAAEATCTDLPVGFSCQCPPGYTGDGTTCADLDECLTGPNTCSADADCANTIGSYTCTCHAGFTGNGESCVDVDECAGGACHPDATCTNTPGSYTCECPAGFTGDGESCTDVDECATNNGGCPASAICVNSPGTYACQCPPGFTDTGSACVDVNECATNNGNCAAGATCDNTLGGFTCTCPAGFAGDGFTCADVDECLVANGGCAPDATCVNAPGTFSCSCNAGFTGNGNTCTDVNECATNNGGCSANATCTNAPGSRICACNPGFSGNGVTCNDVNECNTNNGGCSSHATCTNSIGSFSCACDAGYAGNGFTCADVDECLTSNGGCSPYALCTNTLGGRTCACNAGYTGNGVTCAAPPPLVTGVTPSIGADGTIVTITGSSFVPDATVTFRYGATALLAHWTYRLNATTLKASAPLIPVGTLCDVEVNQPGASTVVYASAFTGAAPQTATISTAITIDSSNVASYRQKFMDVLSTGVVTLNGPIELTSLTVRSGGRITHVTGSTTGATLWVGLTATISNGGAIDLTGRGYRGGRHDGNASATGETWSASGATTTGGATDYGGGSYASLAQLSTGTTNAAYGDHLDPTLLGSGGGSPSATQLGGNGGGFLFLAAQHVALSGDILAVGGYGTNSGGTPSNAGGGSGGSVRVRVMGGTFSGTSSGTVSVAGGYDNHFGHYGGGGRIAITGYSSKTYAGTYVGEGTVYLAAAADTNKELTLTRSSVSVSVPTNYLNLTAKVSSSYAQVGDASIGTLLADTSTMAFTGTLAATTATFQNTSPFTAPVSSTFGSLSVLSSSTLTVPAGRALQVTGTFTYGTNTEYTNAGLFSIPAFARGSGATSAVFTNTGELLHASASALTLPSGLTLSQGGNLHAQALPANTLVGLTIASSAVLTHPAGLEAGLTLAVNGTLNVQTGGDIDVTDKGYAGGRREGNASATGQTWSASGPTTVGGATSYGPGSYASTAHVDTGSTNAQYGSYLDPSNLGSGGGSSSASTRGGNGGGYVNITAVDVIVNGAITANGGPGQTLTGPGGGSGGGSGGTVRLRLTGGTFSGTGPIAVAGGYDNHFGNYGGGGRVAITGWTAKTYSGTFGGEGTVSLVGAGDSNKELTLTNATVTVAVPTNYAKLTVKQASTFTQTGNAAIGTLLVDASAFVFTGTLNTTTGTFQNSATFTAPVASSFGALSVLSSSSLTIPAGRALVATGSFTYGTNVVLTNAGVFTIPAFTRGSGATSATLTNTGEIIHSGSGALVLPSGLTLSQGGNLHGTGLTANTLAGLTIASSAVLTHPAGHAPGLTLKLNGTLNVQTGGDIDVTDKGYAGGRREGNASSTGQTWSASGPTTVGGATGYGPGSYASTANVDSGTTNAQYGSYLDPSNLGSGGGSSSASTRGGNGGGYVNITAVDVIVNGAITANGGPGQTLTGPGGGSGGGSGGTVRLRLTGGTFSGTGPIAVAGGYDNHFGNYGGGGRVAITGWASKTYSGTFGGQGTVSLVGAGDSNKELVLTNATVNVATLTNYAKLTLNLGSTFTQTANATIGTLLVDASVFNLVGTLAVTSGTFQNSATFNAPATSTFSALSVLSSSTLTLTAGRTLTISGAFTYGTNVVLTNAGILSFAALTRGSGATSATLTNTGELVHTGSGALVLPTGLTLSQGGNLHGSLLGPNTLAGLTIASNALLTHPAGHAPGLTLTLNGTLNVQTGGDIDVTDKGYAGGRREGNASPTGQTWSGSGPTTVGGATGYGPGSYASTAHVDSGTTNAQYGSYLDPSNLGSGGGSSSASTRGGNGGGYVNITAVDIIVSGAITANGGPGQTLTGPGGGSGGGSGGTVRLRLTGDFSGTGPISVAGGYDNHFGNYGGGGRIAITGWTSKSYSGTFGGQGTVSLVGAGDSNKELTLTNTVLNVGTATNYTSLKVLTGAAFTQTGNAVIGTLLVDGSTFGLTGTLTGTTATFQNTATFTAPASSTFGSLSILSSSSLAIAAGRSLTVSGTFTYGTNTVLTNAGTLSFPAFTRGSGATSSTLTNTGTLIHTGSGALVLPTGLTLSQGGTIRGSSLPANTLAGLTIASNAVLTHPAGQETGLTLTLNGALNVQTGGDIDVTDKGYAGGLREGNPSSTGQTWSASGPTTVGGATGYGPGSYASTAHVDSGTTNAPYGSYLDPSNLGSGGGSSSASTRGGNGGGYVNITAVDVTVSGAITANGGPGQTLTGPGGGSGGGSGGTVRLRLLGGTFAGAGSISVAGGYDNHFGNYGGGGRIAITGHTVRSYTGSFLGTGTVSNMGVDTGTGQPNVLGQLIVDGPTVTSTVTATYDSILVRNTGNLIIGGAPTATSVTANAGGRLTIGSGASLLVPTGGTLLFSGASPSLWIGPGGTLTSVAPTTSGASTASLELDGTWVLPANTLTIPANLRVVHGGNLNGGGAANTLGSLTISSSGILSHPLGYAPGVNLTLTGTLSIPSNGAIDVSGMGLRGGLSNGNLSSSGESPVSGSTGRSGGSYGGLGEVSTGTVNATYGASTTVSQLGSGGATNTASPGGDGGGRVNITAQAISITGRILANGVGGSSSGSGSGGAIRLTLTGGAFTVASAATLSANGGTTSGTGGSGGGGRIHVSGWGTRSVNASATVSVTGGAVGAGDGTKVY